MKLSSIDPISPMEEALRLALERASLGPMSARFCAEQLRGLPGCPELPGDGELPCSAVLLGATRETFSKFQKSGMPGARPYEQWIEAQVLAAVRQAELAHAQIIFSHCGPPFLPFQRVAELCGFGEMSPCGLIFHSQYGLWISLPAIIIWADGSEVQSASPLESMPQPCSSCSAPCQTHWERAQKGLPLKEEDRALASQLPQLNDAQKQLALIRLVCPYRPEARYSPEQLLHHYGSVSEERLQRARS